MGNKEFIFRVLGDDLFAVVVEDLFLPQCVLEWRDGGNFCPEGFIVERLKDRDRES